MPVRVVGSRESAALDAAAIAGGIPSRALMRAAAYNAATVICDRYPADLCRGVVVLTGPGNNGGDGWAVAAALASTGISVRVREVVPSRTPDALAERAQWHGPADGGPLCCGVIVDAMLGTGSSGELRDAMRDAATEIAATRSRGAVVVALDVPSGLDALTGAHASSVVAELTISFGSCKRGTLVSRGVCGDIVVVDIGLDASADASLPTLVDAAFVKAMVPPIAADAHKGTRKSVAIVAGAANMGGAAILAATAALRSGVGLVQVVTDPANVSAMHTQIPEALVAPMEKASSTIENWADAVLIGPGLGTDDSTRSFIREVIAAWRGPIVVDAGAISAFDGDIDGLSKALRGRPAVITPHPGELAKLTGRDIQNILDSRFDIGLEIAGAIGAAVLLKGTPTVVSGSGGERLVVAAGTPALATGGSGDALSGMVVTLLAQGCAPDVAAACAAWVHGRAAELTPGVRGFRLLDIVERLPQAWATQPPSHRYPVIASLTGVA